MPFSIPRIASRRSVPSIFCLLFVVLAALPPQQASAWGREGHGVTWVIAEMHLTTEARAMTEELIGDLMAEEDAAFLISTWADAIRNERRDTGPWHYVNFPWENTSPRPEDLVIPSAFTAINRSMQRVRNTSLPHGERKEAILYLIHLIGDVHQPLHCGLSDDRGGNSLFVRTNEEGNPVNLHSYWDTTVVRQNLRGRSIEEYGQYLGKGKPGASGEPHDIWFGPMQGADIDVTTNPLAWITESRSIMVPFVYNYQKSGPGELLSGEYQQRAADIAETRLLLAGLRIAVVLNEIAANLPELQPALEELPTRLVSGKALRGMRAAAFIQAPPLEGEGVYSKPAERNRRPRVIPAGDSVTIPSAPAAPEGVQVTPSGVN